ncbi:MAG: hypothetical protein HRT69_06195 [Flavobacteriaceae bacterium]|nr:hypothetical protein [Flavobacteriaceae bacterium]
MKTSKKSHRVIALFFVLNFITTLIPCNQLLANNNGPVAPEAVSFESVDSTDMVNLVTGDMSYVLPVMNVPSPEGGYPLALSYHAGIAMDQEASWVGLGWNLNPGAITRSVSGLPDDWGKTEVNELFYDVGGVVNTYSFSIGGTLPNGITLGMSTTWGGYKSWGGIVGYGGIVRYGYGTEGASMGVSIPGVGLNVSDSSGYTASLGIGGVGTSYNFNSGNFGATYGGLSYDSASNSFGVGIGRNGTGISWNSKSGTSYSIMGMSTNTQSSSVNNGDYYTNTKNRGFNLDLGAYWISWGKSTYTYGLYKEEKTNASGILYNYDTKESPDANTPYRLKQDVLTDVNKYNYLKGITYNTVILALGNESLILPSYDNYSISAQGISGNISPKITDEINLYQRGQGYIFTHGPGFVTSWDLKEFYLDVPVNTYHDNMKLNDKIFFGFNNNNHSFFRQKKGDYFIPSQFLDPGTSTISSTLTAGFLYDFSDEVFVNQINTTPSSYTTNITSDGNKKTNNGRIRDGEFVEVFTNKQIKENNIEGMSFVEAKDLNRNESHIHDKGIGAYRVTALDGKVYHYSLPVYSFENITKSTKLPTNEYATFYEMKKEKAYASHWLLTAITGPDYVDVNMNGQVDKSDYGYWVEFEYGKWSDGYGWRSPKTGYHELDGSYNYFWGRKQIYYLDVIETRTHKVLFIKSTRKDAKGSSVQINNTPFVNGFFDTELHSKKFPAPNKTVIPSGTYYNSIGELINYTSGQQTWREGKKTHTSYVDIPVNTSLKLDKILLVKNTDNVVVNKSAGADMRTTLYSTLMFNTGYTDVHYSFSGTSRESFFNKSSTTVSGIHYNENVLDYRDDAVLGLTSKAQKVIEFNYDYSLLQNSPNSSAILKGALTLKSFELKGKSGGSLLPPYKFEYHDQSYHSYNQDNKDNWGYLNDNPQAWSLTQIQTPIGTKLQINYESDSFNSEAITPDRHPIKYRPCDDCNLYDNLQQYVALESIDWQQENVVFNFDLDALDYNNISLEDTFMIGKPMLVSFYINRRFHTNEYLIKEISNTTIKTERIKDATYDTAVEQLSFCEQYVPYNNCIEHIAIARHNNASEVLANSANPNGKTGGGIRVKSIKYLGTENSSETHYSYTDPYVGFTSGVTSYEPSNGDDSYNFGPEIPAPNVLYSYVEVSVTSSTEELLSKTHYNFETLKPFAYSSIRNDIGERFQLKNAFKLITDQKIGYDPHDFTVENTQVFKNTIERYTNNLGRINYISKYGIHGQLLNNIKYNYKENLETDGQVGVYQESFKSVKAIQILKTPASQNLAESFYVHKLHSSSSVKYPSILESIVTSKGGHTQTTHFDKHDFLTGEVLETTTVVSDGTKLKTKIIPAYTKLEYSGEANGFGMGAKVDNLTNNNMLSQQAANYNYIYDNTTASWKETGVGVTTWNNDWEYRNVFGNASSPTANNEKVWRKHKSYTWKGAIDINGALQGFTDDFNWGVGTVSQSSGWQTLVENTLYNHFSKSLETKDINNNYAAIKMCDNDSKVMVVANARYTEMYYSGAEYFAKDSNAYYFDGEVKSNHLSGRTDAKSHTGTSSVIVSPGGKAFQVTGSCELVGANFTKDETYKISAWVHKDNYTNARLVFNGVTKLFNGEVLPAGDWVLMNHYEKFDSPSSSTYDIYITTTDGDLYVDDFRLHPIESTMTSYVYNELDELTFIIGANNLAICYEYEAGKLSKTYSEIIDNATVTGGFKLVKHNRYNYKN